MPAVSTNAAAIAARMRARAERVTPELHQAAKEIGAVVSGESKKTMQTEIYDVPIPPKWAGATKANQRTTKGANGRWQRTGNLKRRELFRVDGVVVYLTNDANYAAKRYTLGTAHGAPIRTPSTRSVQWQWAAILKKRPFILERRRQAVLKALAG